MPEVARTPARHHALIALALGLLLARAAGGHTTEAPAEGFISGFMHPLSGPDHMLAMLAVGLWGAQLGPPALWLLPVTFPMIMAFGGLAGLLGLPLPGVEIGIAISAIALGGVVLAELKPPLWVAAVLVGLFGVFHGNAHGTELPEGASALLYSMGFVIATGTIHLCGIAIGVIHRWPAGKITLRALGAAVAVAGCFFLWDALA